MAKIKLPEAGSYWSAGDGVKFRVVETIFLDDNTWVHYIRLNDNTEYSCYVESFLQRFSERPE